MKIWKYEFEVYYGQGQGIIIGGTKQEALEKVKELTKKSCMQEI